VIHIRGFGFSDNPVAIDPSDRATTSFRRGFAPNQTTQAQPLTPYQCPDGSLVAAASLCPATTNTMYVCPDGVTHVDDPSMCPAPATQAQSPEPVQAIPQVTDPNGNMCDQSTTDAYGYCPGSQAPQQQPSSTATSSPTTYVCPDGMQVSSMAMCSAPTIVAPTATVVGLSPLGIMAIGLATLVAGIFVGSIAGPTKTV
jgi:hypothetical protein